MIGSTTMGVSLIWMLVLLTGLVLLVIWIVKLLFPQGSDASKVQEQEAIGEVSLDTIKRRYGPREINREELERLEHGRP